jgi:hypothetical protein
VAFLELGTVLLAFGGMAAFFAWTARLERRRLRAVALGLLEDATDYEVLVVELDGGPQSGLAVRDIARILRAV